MTKAANVLCQTAIVSIKFILIHTTYSKRTVQTMSELKPCPFCGYDLDTKSLWHSADGKFWQVQCPACGVMTDWEYGMDKAINAWNRRVSNG